MSEEEKLDNYSVDGPNYIYRSDTFIFWDYTYKAAATCELLSILIICLPQLLAKYPQPGIFEEWSQFFINCCVLNGTSAVVLITWIIKERYR